MLYQLLFLSLFVLATFTAACRPERLLFSTGFSLEWRSPLVRTGVFFGSTLVLMVAFTGCLADGMSQDICGPTRSCPGSGLTPMAWVGLGLIWPMALTIGVRRMARAAGLDAWEQSRGLAGYWFEGDGSCAPIADDLVATATSLPVVGFVFEAILGAPAPKTVVLPRKGDPGYDDDEVL